MLPGISMPSSAAFRASRPPSRITAIAGDRGPRGLQACHRPLVRGSWDCEGERRPLRGEQGDRHVVVVAGRICAARSRGLLLDLQTSFSALNQLGPPPTTRAWVGRLKRCHGTHWTMWSSVISMFSPWRSPAGRWRKSRSNSPRQKSKTSPPKMSRKLISPNRSSAEIPSIPPAS